MTLWLEAFGILLIFIFWVSAIGVIVFGVYEWLNKKGLDFLCFVWGVICIAAVAATMVVVFK